MTQKNSSKIISVVHPICCGLDVHKDMVSACIIITAPDGEGSLKQKVPELFRSILFFHIRNLAKPMVLIESKEPQPGTNALQVEVCF